MKKCFAGIQAVVLFLTLHTATYADGIYVDFGDILPGLPSSYGGAAQVPGVWNVIATTGMTVNLVGTSGSATPAFLTLEAESASGTIGTDNGYPDGRLLGDNFYCSDGINWSITLGGLPEGLYDVYYFQPSYYMVSTGEFTFADQRASSLTDHAKTLIPGVTWRAVRDVQVVGGELSIASASTAGYRGLAGLQIVTVPEPSAFGLFGLGSLVVVWRLGVRQGRAQTKPLERARAGYVSCQCGRAGPPASLSSVVRPETP
jgi:hypothetical protein